MIEPQRPECALVPVRADSACDLVRIGCDPSLQVAANSVADARNALLAAAGSSAARVISSQLDESDPKNVSSTLEIDIDAYVCPFAE